MLNLSTPPQNMMGTLAHEHLYSMTTSPECFLGLGGLAVGRSLNSPCAIPRWSVRPDISCPISHAIGNNLRTAFSFAVGPVKKISNTRGNLGLLFPTTIVPGQTMGSTVVVQRLTGPDTFLSFEAAPQPNDHQRFLYRDLPFNIYICVN
jgi:hypothetical protein